MQSGTVKWDAIGEPFGLDLTTKFTALYLMASVLVFVVVAIRSLVILRRLGVSAALLRMQDTESPNTDARQSGADSSPTQQFKMAYVTIQVAVVDLRRWMQLTVLILLVYSATETADLLRGISMTKMTGISALSGSLANVATMWIFVLWLMAALWVANWILSHRLTRCAYLRADTLR
jgi:hypothetical protein